MRKKSTGSLIAAMLLLAVAAIGLFERNAIYDWLRLRNYTPSAQVLQLASVDGMTTYAKHMFYVNHPTIQDSTDFNSSCPNNGGEQTIVLGCYHGNETGIFLYSVSDPQLNGVEQVTAAHETLHAIYERLSNKDRNYVDGLLTDYYEHDLKDQRLLDTIAAYKKTEPNDVVNEMHSVFGTEAPNLPPALETYYSKYFTNRAQIVSFAANYEKVFTDKQAQAAQIMSQIKIIEAQLNSLKLQINDLEANLESRSRQLESERNTANDVQAFNAQVDAYNADYGRYKNLINQYNALIEQHNQLVAQYRTITVETNQLIQELNSRASTVQAQ